MNNKKILKVKVITTQFVDDFERRINKTVEELEKSNREVEHLNTFSKEGKLVAVIQYKEYLDEIENLPDVVY